jgi:hypothetical protein
LVQVKLATVEQTEEVAVAKLEMARVVSWWMLNEEAASKTLLVDW